VYTPISANRSATGALVAISCVAVTSPAPGNDDLALPASLLPERVLSVARSVFPGFPAPPSLCTRGGCRGVLPEKKVEKRLLVARWLLCALLHVCISAFLLQHAPLRATCSRPVGSTRPTCIKLHVPDDSPEIRFRAKASLP
jgi:hypothetical protein